MRFTIELYNADGILVSHCGTKDPVMALADVSLRASANDRCFDFVHATCYMISKDKTTVQWELEIK